jgi:hypothetical protein
LPEFAHTCRQEVGASYCAHQLDTSCEKEDGAKQYKAATNDLGQGCSILHVVSSSVDANGNRNT